MANDNLARLPTDSDVDNEEQSAGEQPGFSVIQGGNQGDGNPRAKMRVVPKKSGDAESDKPVTVVSNDPNNKAKVTQVDFKQERKGEPQSQPGTVSPFRGKTAPSNTGGDNTSALNNKQNIDQQQTSSNNGSFTKDDALEDQAQKNDQSLSEEQPKSQNEDGESLEQKTEEGDDTQQGQQKKEKEGPVEFAKRHKKDYDERVKESDKAKAKADSPEEVPKSETTAEGQTGMPGKGSVKAGEELAEEGVEDAARLGGVARTAGRGAQAERAAAGVIRGGAEAAEVAGTAAKAGVGLTGNAIKAGVAGAEAGSKAANISGALSIGGAVIDAGADIANRKHKIEEASGLGKVTETAKLGADIAIDAAAAVAETAATAANVAPGVGVAINIAIESAKAVIKSGLDDTAVWLIAICILCLVSIVFIPIGFLPLIVLDAFLVGSIIGIRQPMGWMKMTITGVLNAIYLIGIAFWFALFFVVLCNLPGAQWLSTAGQVTSYVPGATYFVPGLEKFQALSEICGKLSLSAGGGGGGLFGGGGSVDGDGDVTDPNYVPANDACGGDPSGLCKATYPNSRCTSAVVSRCNSPEYETYFNQGLDLYHSRGGKDIPGADMKALLKAVASAERSCTAVGVCSRDPDTGRILACGMMQFIRSTAQLYASPRCGASVGSPFDAWANGTPSIQVCMAAAHLYDNYKNQCGSQIRNIAAGYNAGPGNCERNTKPGCSVSSCDGTSPLRKWECSCNRSAANYKQTTDYARFVSGCYYNAF